MSIIKILEIDDIGHFTGVEDLIHTLLLQDFEVVLPSEINTVSPQKENRIRNGKEHIAQALAKKADSTAVTRQRSGRQRAQDHQVNSASRPTNADCTFPVISQAAAHL